MSWEPIFLLDTTIYVCNAHCVFQLIIVIYLCHENCIFYIESIIHVCNDGIFTSPFIQWKSSLVQPSAHGETILQNFRICIKFSQAFSVLFCALVLSLAEQSGSYLVAKVTYWVLPLDLLLSRPKWRIRRVLPGGPCEEWSMVFP